VDYSEIRKPSVSEMELMANLTKESELVPEFNWQELYKKIGARGDKFNIAYLAIDSHCQTSRKDKIALYWEGASGEQETYTFDQLRVLTNKFANALSSLGVNKGDRVFIFAERIPELYVAVFGILKLGAVVGPLFSAFGPDPIRDRLLDSGAKILVTTPKLKSKISSILKDLPDLEYVITINRRATSTVEPENNEISYEHVMSNASPNLALITTTEDDYSIMHYTSGTTGKPKGAVHAHKAAIQHYATGKWVLDFHDDDIYWCNADPGWVTGTSYGMFAPWINGISQLIYEGGFSATIWYSLIERYKVTVWYTAPTAVRMLMKAGERVTQKHNLSTLRHICCVGEPLNPEAIIWGLKAFKQAIHDTWWQTETGAILIANYPFMHVRPGSMGKPIPGITAAILDKSYKELPHGEEGHLAIKPGWPSMFKTYWNNDAMYQSKFNNGWYITGDRAWRDSDGYFWFVGRNDDVINTAGHLVGPFEVESALIEHPAVAEAGVIGKPDSIAMEIVKAFVSLKDGFSPSTEMENELIGFTRNKLASGVAPREIEFLQSLPKTRSGKIMRRLLKAKELGLPLGDTSTLEDD